MTGRRRDIIILRTGTLADVGLAGAMMRRAFDPAFGEAWTDSQLSAQLVGTSTSLTLAICDAQPAGFALTRHVAGETELLLIATDPPFRGRGIGGVLVDAVLADARAAAATAVFLEVRRGNPAERLYASRGFACVGERPGYYRGAGGLVSDARTFRRDIAPPAG